MRIFDKGILPQSKMYFTIANKFAKRRYITSSILVCFIVRTITSLKEIILIVIYLCM